MKELDTPAPLVAKAEKEVCSAITNLAERVAPLYKQGQKLRAQMNGVGIEIGRHIIETCRAAEVEAQLNIINSKDKKISGGTDTRAHSWVSDQLARATGYSPEYLKQCARQYLGALKQHCAQTRVEAPDYGKGGVLKCALKELPTLEMKPPIVDPPKHPRMDELFTPETKSAKERAKEIAERVQRSIGEADRAAWKEFFNAISPVADANGFSIMVKGKNGGSFK